jgi:malate dehydrogenase
MKISVIGAGNVGGLTAMRLAEAGLGEIMLCDVVKGLAQGKAQDMHDSQAALKYRYSIEGSDDISKIQGSQVIIITAGLARKPGMTREELLQKNSQIIKDIALQIKDKAPQAIVIVVTNPLDLMTYLVLKISKLSPKRVVGMGVNLDAARFTNLISRELNIPNTEINALVIGAHGEGMLPLARLTQVKGVSLEELIDEAKLKKLIAATVNRGAEVVSLLGSGSAYFAPSAALLEVVRAVAGNQKRTIGLSVYLNGEYGLEDICIGVPCLLGKNGIEKIIELDLNSEERQAFLKTADSIKANLAHLKI